MASFTKPRIENNVMIAHYIICKSTVKKKTYHLVWMAYPTPCEVTRLMKMAPGVR